VFSRISDEQIEIANNSDLPSVMQNLGYDLKREGNSYRIPGNGGLILYQKNGQWKWNWFSGNTGGNAISLLMKWADMSFPDAVSHLAPGFVNYQPVQTFKEKRNFFPKKILPAKPEINKNLWQEKSLNLVEWAEKQLWSKAGKKIRDWLRTKRGLQDETIKRFRLGWISDTFYRRRQDWGLQPELKDDGRPKSIWIPQGLVIPYLNKDKVIRIRFRPENKIPPYKLLEGSNSKKIFSIDLKPDHPAMVVESELDAFLLSQEANGLTGILGLGSLGLKPDEEMIKFLSSLPILLVSLDVEYGKDGELERRTLNAFKWWKENFGNVKFWPVPCKFGYGKDPGEAWLADVDLNLWIKGALKDI